MCFSADNPPGIKSGTEAMASYLSFLFSLPNIRLAFGLVGLEEEKEGVYEVRRVGERSGHL